MTPGVLLALLMIVGIFAAYLGALWLMVSAESPIHQRRRRDSIDAIVARETSDLDRRFAEMLRRMRHWD